MAVELRPSQALRLLHELSLAQVRDDAPDLSPRQLAILLSVYLETRSSPVRSTPWARSAWSRAGATRRTSAT